MFRLGLFLILSLLINTGHVFAEDRPQAITFGFIPGDEGLQQAAVELAKDLQNKLKTPVNIYVSKNYQGLIDAMKEKKIDFAFFTATTYVFAEKHAGAKVLLKKVWKEPFYYSTLIALKDSKIKNINDTKGKSIAYVDEKSGSGYLYPRLEIKKKGQDPDKFFSKHMFAGNHQAAVKMVLDKQTDVAAVFSDDAKASSGAWSKFFNEKQNSVKSIWISGPIPNDPFCVRQDFYDKFPKLTHEMMFALIDYKDEPADKNLLKKLFSVNEMQMATSKQYEPVRELVRELKLKLE